MMDLHKRLRELRTAKQMTQEEVAAALHVTRQTVSSYESGRTQPDLETLTRLAELYQVSVEAFVAEPVESGPRSHRIKDVSIFLGCLFFLCSTAHSVLLWAANRFYRAPEGQLSAEMRAALAVRMGMMRVAEWAEVIMTAGSLLLGGTLLLLLAQKRRQVTLRMRLRYLAALAVCAAVTTVPWAVSDPVFGWWNYGYRVVIVLAEMTVLWGVSLLIEYMARKRT